MIFMGFIKIQITKILKQDKQNQTKGDKSKHKFSATQKHNIYNDLQMIFVGQWPKINK